MVPIVGTQVLLSYQEASERDTGAAKLPRLGDVADSHREKASFTSWPIKARLRHVDVARLPGLVVLFYFLVEGDFYFLL